MRSRVRLAILTSHPIQYYAPLFRVLSRQVDLHVFFAHQATSAQQAAAGFGQEFEWDIDLLDGYDHSFLSNVAKHPSAAHFAGCDTPEIGDRLADGAYTHVLSLGWHLKSLLQGIWAAKRQGRKVFIRGDSQLGTKRNAAKRAIKAITYPLFLRQFDAALYVGQKNRDYYRYYGLPERKLFHSPHAIDTERFASQATAQSRARLRTALSVAQTDPLVLFAGKLIDFKRPFDAVEMVATLRQRHGRRAGLLVAGSGPLEAALQERACTLDVPLHMLGFQNQSEMPSVYAASDVLVLPSTARETWGLVANEALAAGKPIVVSDAIGSAPDLAADGKVGRTFPCGDSAAAATALNSVLLEPPSNQDIKNLSDRHSLEAAAKGIMEAIADLPSSTPA